MNLMILPWEKMEYHRRKIISPPLFFFFLSKSLSWMLPILSIIRPMIVREERWIQNKELDEVK